MYGHVMPGCYTGAVATFLLYVKLICQISSLPDLQPAMTEILISSQPLTSSLSGVLLSFLELIKVIQATDDGRKVGEISASWQNFLICVEMLASAFLLRVAFPCDIYDKVIV